VCSSDLFAKQESFAFHNGNGSQGANVAQPQNGRTIANDGNRIAFYCEFGCQLGVLSNKFAWTGDARRIGQREVFAGIDGHFPNDRNLST